MQYISTYQSPIGMLTLVSDGENLTGIWFDEQKYFSDKMLAEKKLPVFAQTNRWLDCYFKGEIPDFTPPLYLNGSPFRLEVWEILKQIPYGEVITYGEIAKMIAGRRGGERMSAQAVGGAVGHNPISIIIPCHRVIGSDGSLTGYGGGIDKKVQLLKLEKVNMKTLFVPKKGTAL